MLMMPKGNHRKIADAYRGIIVTEGAQTRAPGSIEARLAIIVPYLTRKLGHQLHRYGGPGGIDDFTNDGLGTAVAGHGVKYTTEDGRMVRFNFDASGAITTVDIWGMSGRVRDYTQIDAQCDTRGLSIVSLLPFIVDQLAAPKTGEFNEVPFDPDTLQSLNVDSRGIKEGVKKEVIVDGQKFENKEAAIKFLVDQKKENPRLARAMIELVDAGKINWAKKGTPMMQEHVSVKDGAKNDVPFLSPEQIEAQMKAEKAELMRTGYATIEVATKALIKQKVPEKWSVLLYGSAGAGKTTLVEKALKEGGLVKDEDYIIVTGQATPRGVFDTLRKNSDKIIVFDDCDSSLKGGNPALEGMMKGALNTSKHRVVSWIKFDPKEEEETEFEFTGKIIFVTNLEKEQIPEALVSRASLVKIVLDNEQMLERTRDLLQHMIPSATLQEKTAGLKFLETMSKKHPSIRIDLRSLGACVFYMKSGDPNWQKYAEYSIFHS